MLDELVAQSYAVWDDSNSKLQCHVTHKKFEDWGASIYKWVCYAGDTATAGHAADVNMERYNTRAERPLSVLCMLRTAAA